MSLAGIGLIAARIVEYLIIAAIVFGASCALDGINPFEAKDAAPERVFSALLFSLFWIFTIPFVLIYKIILSIKVPIKNMQRIAQEKKAAREEVERYHRFLESETTEVKIPPGMDL